MDVIVKAIISGASIFTEVDEDVHGGGVANVCGHGSGFGGAMDCGPGYGYGDGCGDSIGDDEDGRMEDGDRCGEGDADGSGGGNGFGGVGGYGDYDEGDYIVEVIRWI